MHGAKFYFISIIILVGISSASFSQKSNIEKDSIKLFENSLIPNKARIHTLNYSLSLYIYIYLIFRIALELYSKNEYNSLPSSLADIYHFHLHPENLPDAAAGRMRDVR